MRAGKSSRQAKPSNIRRAYRQGARKIEVESLDDVWAVRFAESAKASVQQVLRKFGEVREIATQRLFVVELAKSAQQDELSAALTSLLDRGDVEFFKPVLRDPESRLQQILTDEISVRFKKVPSAKDLKAVEKKYGVIVERRNEFVPSQFIVKTSRSIEEDTLEVASRMDEAEEVEFAAPNFISEHRR